MWDTIISALGRPDTWTIGIGILYAVAIGTARFIVQKFGLKVRISLKAPKVDQPLVDNLINKELTEWKSRYTTLEALFEVSRSQWSEKIEEQAEEIVELKVENETLQKQKGNENETGNEQQQPQPPHKEGNAHHDDSIF
jgi:hypothetical protein